jgi:hypothetical protein
MLMHVKILVEVTVDSPTRIEAYQAAKKAALETPDKVTWYPRGAEFMNGHPVDYDYDERIDG